MTGRNIKDNIQKTLLVKALTRLLRHEAPKQGVTIGSDGFCLLSEVLKVKYIQKYNPTILDLKAVMDANELQLEEIDGE